MRVSLQKKIIEKNILALITATTMLMSSIPVGADMNVTAGSAKNVTAENTDDVAVEGAGNTTAENDMSENTVADIIDGLNPEDYVEGEVVVTYRDVAGQDVGNVIDRLNGISLDEVYEFGDEFYMTTAKSKNYSTEELISIISEIDGVTCVEPNYIFEIDSYNDEYYEQQWALENNYNTYTEETYSLNFESVGNIEGSEDEKIIAIVDTGVDYTHEDLAKHMWVNPYDQSELEGVHGYDYGSGDADPMDYKGHGTHCAGIMVAEANNNKGIVGLASRDNIKLMALKVFTDAGGGKLSNVVPAYNYIYKAQCLGANIVAINNSWGGTTDVETLDTLIETVGEKGALTVCAAGNNGENVDENLWVPSKYESDYIITVAACDELGKLASFSNYGKKNVDLAAPGTNILSTVSYNSFTPSIYENPDEICQSYNKFDSDTYKIIMDENGYTEETVATGENGYSEEIVVASENGYTEDAVAVGEQAVGIINYGDAKVSVGKTQTANTMGRDYDNNSCLKWEIKDAVSGDYWLVVPYSVLASNADTYRSLMIKVAGETTSEETLSTCKIYDALLTENISDVDISANLKGKITCNLLKSWQYLSGKVCAASEEDSQRAIYLKFTVNAPGYYEVCIDNLGVSKENVSIDNYEKYNYMSGTSMACPYVTAAVAIASEKYPEDDALSIKDRLMASVILDSTLQDTTSTGGRLDMSLLDDNEPVTPELTDSIEINGYQISTTVEGFRVVYSIDTGNEEIESFGLVYGLENSCGDTDLIVGSKNETVHSYEATLTGKNYKKYSTKTGYDSYVMTMDFTKTAEFYNTNIVVRAYAKMKDGSYKYTPMETFSVYAIADNLYKNQLMTSIEGHSYLYDNILSVVNTSYLPVEYDIKNMLYIVDKSV